MKHFLLGSLLFFFANACVNRNMKDFVTSAPLTDSTVVSFNNDIHPILVNHHCFDCHSPGSGVSGAPDWTIFTNFQTAALQKYNSSDPGSKLYMRINFDAPYGPRMPKGGTPLPQSEINLIERWISQGALNN
jgi:hypothetical protein